ncbi:MAG: ThiF family adenylyltransferase [Patescibacteria group bacterium]
MEKDQPNDNILLARRSLEDIDGYELIDDWQFDHKKNKWYIKFSLTLDAQIEGKFTTNWLAFVHEKYPAGKIKIYPSKENGIEHTYLHQEFNQNTVDGIQWRTGAPCLEEPLKVVGRDNSVEEPFGSAPGRLRWYIERLMTWIHLASQNMLIPPGDPFEVPPIPATKLSNILVTAEDSKTFGFWSHHFGKSGIFYFTSIGKKNNLDVVSFFKVGKEPLKYEWGEKIPLNLGNGILGIWVLANEVPVFSQWELPQTFDQLKNVLRAQNIDLAESIKTLADTLRSSKNPLLLVGFPIPEFVGGKSCQIHWLGIRLPTLSSNEAKPPNGFRTNQIGRWRNDLKVLRNDLSLRWVETENWSLEEFSRRSMLDEQITSMAFLILGAGALGSVLVEQLAKLGVKNITLVDGDVLKGGNLVRHSLGVDDVGEGKASALQERVNNAIPYASAKGINEYFPTKVPEDIDIVIDCTGSDEVLSAIENYNWPENDIQFYSFSFGINLQKLFVYKKGSIHDFSYQDFTTQLSPWGEKDYVEHPGFKLPKEGIGCWHPAFPGRFDDVTIWSGIAVKEIEKGVNCDAIDGVSTYKIISDDDGSFSGIIKDSL